MRASDGDSPLSKTTDIVLMCPHGSGFSPIHRMRVPGAHCTIGRCGYNCHTYPEVSEPITHTICATLSTTVDSPLRTAQTGLRTGLVHVAQEDIVNPVGM